MGKSQAHKESLRQETFQEVGNGNPVYSRKEINGPPGLEPTRYGDWEKNGRCIDF